MSFDPRNVNSYSIDELKGYIESNEVTFEDLQRCGLRWDKQDELKKIWAKREQDWQTTCATNTISAYEFYLNSYGDNDPHAYEAKMNIQELIKIIKQCYDDLFEDMREDMMKYKPNVMNALFGRYPASEEMRNEDSPYGRFLKADLKLTFDDLYKSGILPEGNRDLEKAIFKNDFEVPQLSIDDLGEVPINRTDVYFLGCPSSGKSCVLAGLLNYLHFSGEMRYLPMMNERGIDGCKPYYNALIRGVGEFKAPRSTGYDTVSFMQLDLGPKRDREITAMELSGEAFKQLSDAHTLGRDIWEQLGVGRCLKNDTDKTLFFLLDYSSIIGRNSRFSAMEQEQILGNALDVFSSDGEGRYGERKCTMSRVRTVTIVITKSDLMDVEVGHPLTREERANIAFDYLEDRFSNFMNTLSDLCHKYGINANNKGHAYEPFVTTFSLGHFFLGNSVIFDPTDSKAIADIIIQATPKRRKGIFGVFEH